MPVTPFGPAVEGRGRIEKVEGRGGVGHVAIESADAVEVGSVGRETRVRVGGGRAFLGHVRPRADLVVEAPAGSAWLRDAACVVESIDHAGHAGGAAELIAELDLVPSDGEPILRRLCPVDGYVLIPANGRVDEADDLLRLMEVGDLQDFVAVGRLSGRVVGGEDV